MRNTGPMWSYEGATGPDRWASLDPAWVANIGDRQSPIDLPTSAPTGYAALEVEYSSSPASVTIDHQSLRLDFEDEQKAGLKGTEYSLDHVHMHTASEHTVDGEFAPFEIHLVHADAYGRFMVLGVLGMVGKEASRIHLVLEQAQRFDPSWLLPQDQSRFWLYEGSLTTPPLSETVTWVVFADRLEASDSQVSALEAICHGNRRPVQPTMNRRVERVGFAG